MEKIATLLLKAMPRGMRFTLYDRRHARIAHGVVDRLGTHAAYLEVTTDDAPYAESVTHIDHRAALRSVIDYLHRNSHIDALLDIHAVVHLLPHGGTAYPANAVLTHDDLPLLYRVAHLAPEGRAAAGLVHASLAQLPSAIQIGIFDTAVGSLLPEEDTVYALPAPLIERFHLRRAPHDAMLHSAALRLSPRRARRVITLVIDEEVSMCAFLDGMVQGTSSGFTKADGLPGLYRSGSVDPRIPLHLAAHLHATPREIDHLLMRKSGLAGMSGVGGAGTGSHATTAAVYAAIAAAARKQDAVAVRALVHLSGRIAHEAGGLSTTLGGVDAIVVVGAGATLPLMGDVRHRIAHLGKAGRIVLVTKPITHEQAIIDAAARLIAVHANASLLPLPRRSHSEKKAARKTVKKAVRKAVRRTPGRKPQKGHAVPGKKRQDGRSRPRRTR